MASGATHKPQVGDIIRSLCIFKDNLQLAVLRQDHRITATTLGGVTLDDIALRMDGVTATPARTIIPLTCEYRGIVVESVSFPAVLPGNSIVGYGFGITGSTPASHVTSRTVTKITLLRGRSFRGRFYLPFPPIDYYDLGNDGEPTAASNADYTAFVTAWCFSNSVTVGPASSSWTPVVYSKKLATSQDVLTFRLNDKWASQHRRGDYGRTNLSPI